MFKIATPCRYSQIRFVFDFDEEKFRCGQCKLQPKEPILFGKPIHMDWRCGTIKEAIEHLKLHYYSGGHKVPIIAFERLLAMPKAEEEGLVMTNAEFWDESH